jgi:hypothetical protein
MKSGGLERLEADDSVWLLLDTLWVAKGYQKHQRKSRKTTEILLPPSI